MTDAHWRVCNNCPNTYTGHKFWHEHTYMQLFYSSLDFARDNPSEPVQEETFTHSYLS